MKDTGETGLWIFFFSTWLNGVPDTRFVAGSSSPHGVPEKTLHGVVECLPGGAVYRE